MTGGLVVANRIGVEAGVAFDGDHAAVLLGLPVDVDVQRHPYSVAGLLARSRGAGASAETTQTGDSLDGPRRCQCGHSSTLAGASAPG
jgi:hypothetical protein